MGANSEISLVTVTGVMHHYLESQWVIVGPSRIGIYHDTSANTFRIVGRKIDDHEVVANCSISEFFCYNKATPSFHQWRDSVKVYGIKFSSLDEASIFGNTVQQIVESFDKLYRMIGKSVPAEHHHHQQQQPHFTSQPTPSMNLANTLNSSVNGNSLSLTATTTNNNYNSSNGTTVDNNMQPYQAQTQQHQQKLHENSSYSNQADNDNISVCSSVASNHSAGAVVTYSNGRSSKPVPPPPPPPNFKVSKPKVAAKSDHLTSSLANGTAKVSRDSQTKPSGTNSSNSNKGNFLDEIAQTLAKRRAKIEESTDSTNRVNSGSSIGENGSNKIVTDSTSQSFKSFNPTSNTFVASKHELVKRFNSINDSSNSNSPVRINSATTTTLTSSQVDKLKEEIICEFRQELLLFKQDLLHAIKTEILPNLR